MHTSPRCAARCKRSLRPCKAPAVKGWKVCRMHGAGGAPPGSRNGNYRHGEFTQEAMASKLLMRQFDWQCLEDAASLSQKTP